MSAGSDELVVRAEQQVDALVLSLYGVLSSSSVPALEQELEKARGFGAARVVVDLSALASIDVAGVQVFVDAHREHAATGRRLSLLRGPVSVHQVFVSTGAVYLVDFDDDPFSASLSAGSRAPRVDHLRKVLAVASDFDALGGTSLGLTSWELGEDEADLAATWHHCITRGMLRSAGVDEHSEELWRLTRLGREVREALQF